QHALVDLRPALHDGHIEPVLGVRAVGRGLVEPAVLGLGHPVGPEPHPVALLAPRGPHRRDHERGDGGDETADGAHHGYPCYRAAGVRSTSAGRPRIGAGRTRTGGAAPGVAGATELTIGFVWVENIVFFVPRCGRRLPRYTSPSPCSSNPPSPAKCSREVIEQKDENGEGL